MTQNRDIKSDPQAVTQQEFHTVEVALGLILRTVLWLLCICGTW